MPLTIKLVPVNCTSPLNVETPATVNLLSAAVPADCWMLLAEPLKVAIPVTHKPVVKVVPKVSVPSIAVINMLTLS